MAEDIAALLYGHHHRVERTVRGIQRVFQASLTTLRGVWQKKVDFYEPVLYNKYDDKIKDGVLDGNAFTAQKTHAHE